MIHMKVMLNSGLTNAEYMTKDTTIHYSYAQKVDKYLKSKNIYFSTKGSMCFRNSHKKKWHIAPGIPGTA